jgi:NADH-quinone oxidoreductase subunit H
MVLALLIPVLLARTMGINSLVFAQDVWFVALAPLAALMFLTTSIAEIGRAPFDLLEAESEIVAGYQIEYSGLKFGMFYVGDFLHAFTISALTAALFFGGWRGPGAETYPILGMAYFFIKSFLLYFVVVLARIALPRFRIDQMLNFNWKFLTPLALALLMVTAVVEKLITLYLPGLELSDTMFAVVRTLAHLLVNVIVAWGALRLANRWKLPEPKVVAQPRPVATPPNPPASAIP